MKRLTVALTFLIFAGILFLLLRPKRQENSSNSLKGNLSVQDSNNNGVKEVLQSTEATSDSLININDNVHAENVSSVAEFSSDKKLRAERLTSLFENDTIDLQYGYIENLHDGRGYTAGRAGFTTADGDLYDLVKLYNSYHAGNPLEKYTDTLEKLADDESDSTSGLDGFASAWQKATQDPKFIKAQDDSVDQTYYEPAMKRASDAGIKTALGKALFYDTVIQHGDGDDQDSLQAIIGRTTKQMNGTPANANGVDEKKWIQAFIQVRKKDLQYAYNEDTRDVWAESTGRCDVFKNIADSGNYDLNGPITVKTSEYDAIIP